MSAPVRSYIPAHEIPKAHHDPATGHWLISQEALYLGVQQGRVPHVRLILVRSDLLDQLVTKPTPASDPVTSNAA